MNIRMVITAIIFILIGSSLMYYQSTRDVGPASTACQNLTKQGYFEGVWEDASHDSCIKGNYTWKEDCKFMIPIPNIEFRCMWDYDDKSYDKECDKKMWENNKEEMWFYHNNCVTHPFVKIKLLFPGMVGFIFIICGITGLYIEIFGKEIKEAKENGI